MDWALGASPITDLANGEYYSINMFFSFYRLTWVQRCWLRATPDFGSVSVINSFPLKDVPWHPDTRLFEVREAFKRSLLLRSTWFSGSYSRKYRNVFASA